MLAVLLPYTYKRRRHVTNLICLASPQSRIPIMSLWIL